MTRLVLAAFGLLVVVGIVAGFVAPPEHEAVTGSVTAAASLSPGNTSALFAGRDLGVPSRTAEVDDAHTASVSVADLAGVGGLVVAGTATGVLLMRGRGSLGHRARPDRITARRH
ncbi:MAG: hypothetical protein M0R75_15655 [Dehalococcoidia bacterium]|nr:hypothetical protein [Dehalococcoidia bacterium]